MVLLDNVKDVISNSKQLFQKVAQNPKKLG
jgi:hypothetical protein